MGLAERMNSHRQDAVKGDGGVKLAPESKAHIVSGCIVIGRVIPLIPAPMCHFLLYLLLPFCFTLDLPSFHVPAPHHCLSPLLMAS